MTNWCLLNGRYFSDATENYYGGTYVDISGGLRRPFREGGVSEESGRPGPTRVEFEAAAYGGSETLVSTRDVFTAMEYGEMLALTKTDEPGMSFLIKEQRERFDALEEDPHIEMRFVLSDFSGAGLLTFLVRFGSPSGIRLFYCSDYNYQRIRHIEKVSLFKCENRINFHFAATPEEIGRSIWVSNPWKDKVQNYILALRSMPAWTDAEFMAAKLARDEMYPTVESEFSERT